ncbi:MAG: hypothetical protein Q9203_003801 [Teloschistes exilis]
MTPGTGLDGLNRVMIQNIAGSLESLRPIDGQPSRIGLAEWSRHEVTLATTNSVYGEHNPFKDPKVEQAFWEFESHIVMILINVLPTLTSRSSCRAREVVGGAFRKYFERKHHENGFMLVRNRYNTGKKYKISIVDIAQHEIGDAIAPLINTAPATFWVLFYIYSHPEVLEKCRQEAGHIMRVSIEEGHHKRTLDITGIKQNCPTLTSTYQEVLRQRTLAAEIRQVMQDTMLDNTYLLKKGGTIIMPSAVVHTDPAVWGPDALDFNHKRFAVKAGSSSTLSLTPQQKGVKRPNPKAFRVFGGGTTLCPGRHFATTEILAMVLMFIMRYDLTPVEGRWVAPLTGKTNNAAMLMEPDTDVQVDVTPRQGFEEGRWEFSLAAGSETVFELASEDV